jgi:hypothetical protein
MRRHFEEWKAEITASFPLAVIITVEQFGQLVGGFAWVGDRHIGSWPHYLIPGYQMLGPAKDNYA